MWGRGDSGAEQESPGASSHPAGSCQAEQDGGGSRSSSPTGEAPGGHLFAPAPMNGRAAPSIRHQAVPGSAQRPRPRACLSSPRGRSPMGSSHLPQQLKFTTSDSCDRIKDEFQLLQAQYHSLKLECDKLASEKSEMQRHYVMHQQQVLGAIERAKQVTAPELNSIIRQQLQAHQLSQLQALALPLTPLPVGLQPPSLPAVSAGTGLLSLSALGSQAHLSKEDKNGHDGDTHQEDDGEKSD
ncbi:hypothetical protein HPG69_005605 [Diceros bicornis minor]|uniref:Groucho/TLE N-terminal Q-rich domain-containing protein n=1 Tax=Diceros bicornis minor TaxID=77932 RepID=A0A7J7EIN8_DICBM|nr:hypothetical protein HPG69_005605 [Diceros bicornis minor]